MQYKLETFTEARKSAWAFEPYYGKTYYLINLLTVVHSASGV